MVFDIQSDLVLMVWRCRRRVSAGHNSRSNNNKTLWNISMEDWELQPTSTVRSCLSLTECIFVLELPCYLFALLDQLCTFSCMNEQEVEELVALQKDMHPTQSLSRDQAVHTSSSALQSSNASSFQGTSFADSAFFPNYPDLLIGFPELVGIFSFCH
jgi:hypothetical protein